MNEDREYNDELRDAPELKKLGKQNPFQVPDSYFEELAGRIREGVEQEEPQSEILGEIGKGNIFQTPEHYFEGVLERFEQSKQAEAEIKPLRSKPIPYYYLVGIAAAIAVILLVFKPSFLSPSSVELEFAELEDLSMEDLLAEVQPEELTEDMILSTFDPGAWDSWIESESADMTDIEINEVEGGNEDDLIDELDVYTLEEELDNLN